MANWHVKATAKIPLYLAKIDPFQFMAREWALMFGSKEEAETAIATVRKRSRFDLRAVEAEHGPDDCDSCVTCTCSAAPRVDEDGLCANCGGVCLTIAKRIGSDKPHVGMSVPEPVRERVAAIVAGRV